MRNNCPCLDVKRWVATAIEQENQLPDNLGSLRLRVRKLRSLNLCRF
jgi:hypothetical protein